MSIDVHLPPLLRGVAGGARTLEAQGSTIAAVLADLARRHPPLALHFFDEAGAIRPNIVFLHDGAMIRAREAAARRLKPGDAIVITNALAGG
ncbi:MAG TPA: MoaD/ThiS family protein [Rhizomicrobium sp.]